MYPNHVVIEFCHKQQVWRAYDRAKIIAYNTSENEIKALFSDKEVLGKKETVSSGGGPKYDLCRLHYGEPIRARHQTQEEVYH